MRNYYAELSFLSNETTSCFFEDFITDLVLFLAVTLGSGYSIYSNERGKTALNCKHLENVHSSLEGVKLFQGRRTLLLYQKNSWDLGYCVSCYESRKPKKSAMIAFICIVLEYLFSPG